MKICKNHWEDLKSEIKKNGLWDFVAPTKDELAEQLGDYVETRDPTKLDPLWAAGEMIMMQGIKCGGLQMLMPKEDGSEWCPVCEAHSHGQSDWITGPVGAVREMMEGKVDPEDNESDYPSPEGVE